MVFCHQYRHLMSVPEKVCCQPAHIKFSVSKMLGITWSYRIFLFGVDIDLPKYVFIL